MSERARPTASALRQLPEDDRALAAHIEASDVRAGQMCDHPGCVVRWLYRVASAGRTTRFLCSRHAYRDDARTAETPQERSEARQEESERRLGR